MIIQIESTLVSRVIKALEIGYENSRELLELQLIKANDVKKYDRIISDMYRHESQMYEILISDLKTNFKDNHMEKHEK